VKPRSIVFLAVALSAAVSSARAEDPPPLPESCPPFKRLPAPKPGFWPERERELWVDMSFISDWNLDTGKSYPAFGLGFEHVFVVDRDARLRIGPRVGFQLGRWGDDNHAAFSVDPGIRFRWSFYMDPIVDVYLLAKTDLLLAIRKEPQGGLRPGAGFGLRIGRAVQLEGTFDVALAIGDGFVRQMGTTVWAPGLWLSGGFDFCVLGSFCNKPEPQQTTKDDTSLLYDDANRICRETKEASDRSALCAAVNGALDGDRYPPEPDEDSTAAFLGGLQKELARTGKEALAKRVADMLAHHREMERCRRKNLRDARFAAQKKQALAVHYNYSPFPVLLRRALGCDTVHRPAPHDDPVCPNVFERPATSAP
jgi:hypothetical protein